MQIDLANTLVHKAYFVYHALFIISPQAWAPLLRRGRGRLLLPSLGRGWGWALRGRGGCLASVVLIRFVVFDFLTVDLLTIDGAPSVEDVGQDKGYQQRDDGHRTQGELAAATVHDGQAAL